MSYVSRVLQPGETVVHTTTLHWFIYLGALRWAVIAAILLAIGLGGRTMPEEVKIGLEAAAALMALVAIIKALDALIRRATTELAITDRRVIYKIGLFRRSTFEMNLSKVESVGVEQSLLGRMLGFGVVEVKGTGSSLAPITTISDPLKFRSFITASA